MFITLKENVKFARMDLIFFKTSAYSQNKYRNF